MSAIVQLNGKVRQLDQRADADEQVQPDEVGDATRLARRLMWILGNLRDLRRRWRPRSADFEDRTVLGDGTTKYSLPHGFNGRVRYWPVEWVGAAAPNLRRHAESTANVLVVTSTSAGVVTLRVEEAG